MSHLWPPNAAPTHTDASSCDADKRDDGDAIAPPPTRA